MCSESGSTEIIIDNYRNFLCLNSRYKGFNQTYVAGDLVIQFRSKYPVPNA